MLHIPHTTDCVRLNFLVRKEFATRYFAAVRGPDHGWDRSQVGLGYLAKMVRMRVILVLCRSGLG